MTGFTQFAADVTNAQRVTYADGAAVGGNIIGRCNQQDFHVVKLQTLYLPTRRNSSALAAAIEPGLR